MDERVPYELFDTSGDVYLIRVKKDVKERMDIDHACTHRVLEQIKAAGQLPIRRWMPADTSFSPIQPSRIDSSWLPSSGGNSDDDFNSPLRKKRAPEKRNASLSKKGPARSLFSQLGGLDLYPTDCATEPGHFPDDKEDTAVGCGALESLDQSFCAELDDSRLGSQVLNDQEEVHADNGMGGQVWTEQEELPDGIGRGACSSGQSTVPFDKACNKWADPRHTSLLLSEIGKRVTDYNAKRKKGKVFEEVQFIFTAQGLRYSAADLSNKMKSLDTYYRRLKPTNGYASLNSREQWFLFEDLQHIKEGRWPPSMDLKYGLNTLRAPDRAPNNAPDRDKDARGPCRNATILPAGDFSPTDDVGGSQGCGNEEEVDIPAINDITADDTQGWDSGWDKALLEEYAEIKERFDDPKDFSRDIALFGEISEALRKRRIYCTARMCMKRLQALQCKFRKEYDKLNGPYRTGTGPSSWQHYQFMLDLEGSEAVNLQPAVTLSCGAKSQVSRAGTPAAEQRFTKGRPPTANKVDRLIGHGRPLTQKGMAMDLQRRRIETGERFVEEFAAYRKDYRERTVYLKEEAEYLAFLKEKRKSQNAAASVPKDHLDTLN